MGEGSRPDVKTIRGDAGNSPFGRVRIRSTTRRAMAGAGSSQVTGQRALARKRSWLYCWIVR